MEAKGELCEALACMYEAELAFREERDQADDLSQSTIRMAIKLDEMPLQLTEVRKRES